MFCYGLEKGFNRSAENRYCFSQRCWVFCIVRIGVVFFACLQCLIGDACAQTVILDNGYYRVFYNYQLNVPVFVAWKLYKTDIMGKIKRDGLQFTTDKRLKKPRVNAGDFLKSGYQRGHMCPAADWCASYEKMAGTFVMSNIAPQTAALNCGKWRNDEIMTRLIVLQFDSVLVECGTVFGAECYKTIGKHRVAVPDGFWKRVTLLYNDSVLFFSWYEN